MKHAYMGRGWICEACTQHGIPPTHLTKPHTHLTRTTRGLHGPASCQGAVCCLLARTETTDPRGGQAANVARDGHCRERHGRQAAPTKRASLVSTTRVPPLYGCEAHCAPRPPPAAERERPHLDGRLPPPSILPWLYLSRFAWYGSVSIRLAPRSSQTQSSEEGGYWHAGRLEHRCSGGGHTYIQSVCVCVQASARFRGAEPEY